MKSAWRWTLWPFPAKHDPLGVELALQDVADRVERRVVGAGDDELRERRGGERLERDVRLGRTPLADERAGALLELRRERGGRMEVGADGDEEHVEERLRVVLRSALPQLLRAGREGVDRGIAGRDPGRGRLDHRERRHDLRASRRRQKRDHAAVRMADEVVAGLERVGHELGVGLEVHALDRRVGRKPGPVEDDELEPLLQRALVRAR